jgi:hypothetical protein
LIHSWVNLFADVKLELHRVCVVQRTPTWCVPPVWVAMWQPAACRLPPQQLIVLFNKGVSHM